MAVKLMKIETVMKMLIFIVRKAIRDMFITERIANMLRVMVVLLRCGGELTFFKDID